MNQLPTATEALEAWKTVLLYLKANNLEKGYMGSTIKAVSNVLTERALKEEVDPTLFKPEVQE